MMIRSTPALRVCIEIGHVPHAPTRLTCTTPSSSRRVEDDVAAVALERGPDELDRLEHLLLQLGGFEIGVDRHQRLRGGGRAQVVQRPGGSRHVPSQGRHAASSVESSAIRRS